MSTISQLSSLYETAGSVAKSNPARLRNCTPNCPPDCPDCGQVNFKGDEFYLMHEKTRKKKRNAILLTTAGVLAVGIGSVIGLGKLHNSQWLAGRKDGWFKVCMEKVTKGCDKACNFVKDNAIEGWEWITGKFSKKS